MKRIALLLALVWLLALPVMAHEVPDLTREGSITVTMRYDGKAIAGGEITLYRVGDVQEEDGNYSFTPTADYAGSGISFDSVQSPETAGKLAEFANKQGLRGNTRQIASDGTALYQNLKPGLYLLVQNRAAKGFEAVSPFLVTLPMLDGDDYIYQVDAGPKVSPVPAEKPENPEQPKTGQSGLPIWTFSLSAVGLVLLLRNRKLE